MQLHAPRDESERDDSERLQRILAAWGTCPIDEGRITRRGRASQAALDVMTVPGGEAWSWHTRSAWHSGLSDHAICSAWRSAERHATRQVCSPAALRRLPPEAWDDLFCRSSYLGYSCGVRSGWDLPPEAGNRTGCAPAETLPEGHPAMAGLLDDVNGRVPVERSGTDIMVHPAQFNPGLARYGRPFLSAALASWWRTWSRKCAVLVGPHSELTACWRAGRPLEPVGEILL